MGTENEMRAEVHAAIIAALAAKGAVARVDDNAIVFDDGVSITARLRQRTSGWSLELVGTFSRSPYSKTYRKPKTGFRYDDIASTALQFAALKREVQAEEQIERVAEKDAAGIRDALGLAGVRGVDVRRDGTAVILWVHAPATREQIETMVAAARACGLIPPREEPTS